MIYWLDSSTQQTEWIKMEKEDCHPCNIGTILFSPKKLNNTIYKKNPIIYGTIRIWKQIKLSLKLRNLSLLMPIANNPLFKPSLIDKTYNQWESLGIRRIRDMYEMGNLLSFQQLQLKFKLKNNQYFKYLQICDFVKKYIQGYQKVTPDLLEEAMNIEADSQKLISYLYNSILNIDLPSTEVLREEWERELMIKITKVKWEKYLIYIHKCSINVRHNLIQFKIVHRLYYSKTRLNKFYPNISATCDKCLAQKATITHSLVSCIKLYRFWNDIFEILTKLFKTRMEPNTEMIIFGVMEDGNKLNTSQNLFLNYGLIIAKKLILKFWKGTSIPTLKMWIASMLDTAHLEEMRFLLMDKSDQFITSWSPFVVFLESYGATQL